MDQTILNSLIFDYLSKKDKVLAETVKAKLKAVSRLWSFNQLIEIFGKNLKMLSSTFFHRNAFS